jgi:hypothetical protein
MVLRASINSKPVTKAAIRAPDRCKRCKPGAVVNDQIHCNAI